MKDRHIGSGSSIEVVVVSPGRLPAPWTERPEGEYARVLDRRDQSLLAVASVFETEDNWMIETVIPIDKGKSWILVTATDELFLIAV